MGLMDLSTSAASKKHVDFNDARYQLAEKLRQSGKKNVRSTFTLYDNKEYNKIAVQEISAAYALSDKKLPMGELLNKVLDLIIDLEDGILDTEKDAVYTWKYAVALLNMYEDKKKRQETLSIFDNGLKNAIIGSKTFIEKYPGKYTSRTNFFDNKVRLGLSDDIISTFRDHSLKKIHETAIKQSREIAEKHNNPILDKIVQWAVENYKCEVDSFYDVKEDPATNLFFSTNTIILHLRNGYDMSIIGYVGTDHDDRFAISIFDAHNISIKHHGERITQSEIQKALSNASVSDPVDPLTKLLSLERKKNAVLKQQYNILVDIRPMIPETVLEIKAAESVVGQDYIWGCKQFRATHDDLPKDFKLSDVVLPVFDETEEQEIETRKQQSLVEDINKIADSMEHMKTRYAQTESLENTAQSMIEQAEKEKPVEENTQAEEETTARDDNKKEEVVVAEPTVVPKATSNKKPDAAYEDWFGLVPPPEDLFDMNEPKVEEKKFGDPSRTDFKMPTLEMRGGQPKQYSGERKQQGKQFDASATLLPGFTPIVKPKEEDSGPSITKDAQQAPAFEKSPVWKDDKADPVTVKTVEQKGKVDKEEIKQPDLLLDDLDSLFA